MFIGGYIEALDIFGITSGWPVYLVFYAVFVGIHLFGVGEALKVMFVITAIAVVALLVFVVGMIPKFDAVEPDRHRRRPTPPAPATSCRSGSPACCRPSSTASGSSWPSRACPLAAEETRDPKRDMPRGLIAGHGARCSCSPR